MQGKCNYCDRETEVKTDNYRVVCEECNAEQLPHTCPYKVEICGDYKRCTCSKAQEYECAMDI